MHDYKKMRTDRPRDVDEGEVVAPEDHGGSTSGKRVGLDPGKRRIFTMVCEEGKTLMYSAKQRQFENGMLKYRNILEGEVEWKKQRPSCLNLHQMLQTRKNL